MSVSSNHAWLCSDEEVPALFKNLPQAIISLVLFIILLPLSIHFFFNIDVCNCGCWDWLFSKYSSLKLHISNSNSNNVNNNNNNDTNKNDNKTNNENNNNNNKRDNFDFSVNSSHTTTNTNTRSMSQSPSQTPRVTPRLTRSMTSNYGRFNKDDSKTQRKYKYYYGSMVFLALYLLFFTFVGKFLCSYNDINQSVTRIISIFGHILAYGAFGLSMCIIFILRLKQTFEGSNLKVTKESFGWIIIVTILVPFLIVLGVIFYALDIPPFIIFTMEFFADLMYCIMSLMLLKMFVTRLHKVAEGVNASEQNVKLFETMTKMVILVSISIITTLITSFMFIIAALDNSPSFFVIANLLIAFDSFTNTFCFMLQFSFNKKYYFCICWRCHSQCQSCVIPKDKQDKKGKDLNSPIEIQGHQDDDIQSQAVELQTR